MNINLDCVTWFEKTKLLNYCSQYFEKIRSQAGLEREMEKDKNNEKRESGTLDIVMFHLILPMYSFILLNSPMLGILFN